MKIGIFGGHFDPFTPAHLAIANKVIDEGVVDRVLIVPSVVDYYRKENYVNEWLSVRGRCQVIRSILHGSEGKISIDTREVDELENKYYSPGRINEVYVNSRRFIHTLLDIISSDHDNHLNEYYTIIGSDQFANFKSWFCWEQILKLSKLVVVRGRNFGDVDSNIPHLEVKIDSKYARMSATKIREAYKNNTMDKYIADFKSGEIEDMNFDDDPRFVLPMEKSKALPVPGCEGESIEKPLASVGNGEDLISHTPIFDLVSKPEVQPGFRPVGINSPDWVTVILRHNDKFLMVRQLRYGTMTECTEFPCGMVEEGESPREAAARELREETGWDVKPEELLFLGSFAANNAFMNNHMHYFYFDIGATSGDLKKEECKPDEHEKLTVMWQDCEAVKTRIALMGNSSSLMAGAILLLNHHGL